MTTSDDTLLRSLDPAGRELDAGERERAAALLERVVSTPVPERATTGTTRTTRPGGRPNVRRRIAWVAAVAAGVTGVSILLPGVGGSGMAYASWSAVPSTVAARDLDAAVTACREGLRGSETAPGAIGPHFDAARIPVALADRRGDIVSVVFAQDAPEAIQGFCLATVPAGSASVDGVDTGVTGSSGTAFVPPAGRIAEGGMSGSGEVWQLSGTVGAGVTGVTIHLGDVAVEATVAGGRYTAWGPGQAFTKPTTTGGKGGPEPLFSYDVRLADGRVLRDVTPARPA